MRLIPGTSQSHPPCTRSLSCFWPFFVLLLLSPSQHHTTHQKSRVPPNRLALHMCAAEHVGPFWFRSRELVVTDSRIRRTEPPCTNIRTKVLHRHPTSTSTSSSSSSNPIPHHWRVRQPVPYLTLLTPQANIISFPVCGRVVFAPTIPRPTNQNHFLFDF